MAKSVLITGAGGFLGSHLADKFLANGYRVLGVDNFCTGFERNLFHLKNNRLFSLIKHDITRKLPREVSKQRFRLVLNFASPASPPRYQQLATETLRANSEGVKNILEFAKKQGARFVQASTSEVYGDPAVHPQKESYWGNVNSYGERAMYDEGKRFAEALIWVYRHKYRLNSGIVRIFNTYGPRMDPRDGRVVSNFTRQALEGKPLTLYGKGEQTRSFCYVDDLIEGIFRFSESGLEGPLNIGNPREFTIRQLADIIKRKTGSDSQLVFQKMPADDPKRRRPDITRAKRLLGWEPKITLQEGLAKTISWFKEVKNEKRQI